MVRIPQVTGSIWFNTKPLLPPDFQGKTILYDFWTYSCVNCRRTIPHLRALWDKYKSQNFLIIGIHAPEFEFEKNLKNVEKAIADLGIGWPVVLDNDYFNWTRFANHYWPAKYLADKKGNIVYTRVGEGGYAETEKEIIKLLGLPGISAGKAMVDFEHGRVCFRATPETYCGWKRGNIVNREGYKKDQKSFYEFPAAFPNDALALSGIFIAREEYVEPQEIGSEVLVNFHSNEVNLVLAPAANSAKAVVLFDEEIIPAGLRGRDVNEYGEVDITKSDMYNLLKADFPTSGTLSVQLVHGKFRAYAFTFSGCS